MNTTMFHSTQNTSRVSTPQPARSRRRFATVARTTASGTPSTGSSVAPSTTTDSLAVASQAPQSASTGRPVNPYRVSLWDALKFNGPAPELINGRLAMVGFLSGALHESKYGETLLQQVHQVDLLTVALLVMWVYASLVPITKGVKNDEAFLIFSPRAELVNGRAAMLGLAVTAYLEQQAGLPFF